MPDLSELPRLGEERRPRLVAADSTGWLNLRNIEETAPLTTAE